LTIEAAELGKSNGAPNQAYSIPHAPVYEAAIFTLENPSKEPTWHEWTVRPDLDASARADHDVVLEAQAGIVRFGDGEKGRVPPAGSLILARYGATAAEKGNVAFGRIVRLAPSLHNAALLPETTRSCFDSRIAGGARIHVTNPFAAYGGSAGETLDEAIARAVREIETPERAVTLSDYERLALRTPGTKIARAKATAVSGTITVAIVPRLLQVDDSGKVEASDGLKKAVYSYLDRRRMIGSRIEVTAPNLYTISVSARVRAFAGQSKPDLLRRVSEALDGFLDPLSGGPARSGWPFGRDVYRYEVMQVIDEVKGVDKVEELDVTCARGKRGTDGHIHFGDGTALVRPGLHQIEITYR
jgi:predicted phage baseplate assembly protein